MHRFLVYSLFYVVVLFFQVFLFDNLNLGIYIYPLFYISFLLLLPMDTRPVWMLFLALLLGVSLDFMTGFGGLHTIVSLFTAFIRRPILILIFGREDVRDGGAPLSSKVGIGRFFSYITILVTLHSLLFFSFESFSWSFYHLTLLRALLSSIFTIILVYFSQMLLLTNYSRGSDTKFQL